MESTAKNILPFPSVTQDNDPLLQFIDDTPMRQLAMSRPFFKASLPCVPPGINDSYTIVAFKDSRRLAHTTEAKHFLENAGLILSSSEYGEMLDWELFHAIGKSRRRVPLSVNVTFYFDSPWKRDIDGPLKITLDVLFSHLKKYADMDVRQNWNDNRVKHLVVTKEVDTVCPRVLIEVRCLLQSGRA